MIRVLGLGDNVVDHYVHTNMVYPGGNALNFAVFAKMAGYQSAYMGVFGDDVNALHVYRVLAQLRIPVDHSRFYRGESGCAPVNLVDGDRVFLGSNKGGVSKQHPWTLTALDYEYLSGFDLIHTSIFSYIDSQLPEMKARGLRVSYDFSNRFSIEQLYTACPHIWCACLSSSERSYDDNIQLIREVVAHGCPNVILTRGTETALVMFDGELREQSPCLVEPVDTMGAGDSFITTLLTSYLDGLQFCSDFPPAEQPRGLTTAQEARRHLLAHCLHRAAVVSAQTCRTNGTFGFGIQSHADNKPESPARQHS